MEKIQEQFFDIGANLTHSSFEKDMNDVLKEAQEVGVKRMSITGSDLEESIKAAELAKNNPKKHFIIKTCHILGGASVMH